MKQQIIRTTLALMALAAFMITTQPAKLPVIVLIVPFILLFIVILETWMLIQTVYGQYLSKTKQVKKRSQLGRMVSGGLVLILILQSLNQLSLRDVTTITAILIISYLYIIRNRYSVDKR